MKKLISAIARAFRNSVSFVWTRCRETGKSILTAVASIGGAGAVDAGVDIVEEPTVERVSVDDLIPARDDAAVDSLLKRSAALLSTIHGEMINSPGDNFDRIGRLCKDEAAGLTPWHLDFNQLSHLQQQWHETLTPEMVRLVGAANKEEIIAHLKGGKGIKGVVRCDKESLAGWKSAVKIEQSRAVAEMEVPDYIPADEPEWAQHRLAAC